MFSRLTTGLAPANSYLPGLPADAGTASLNDQVPLHALLLVLLLLIVLPAGALADDDTGLYFGVSANRLSADFEDVNDVNFEESDTAGGVHIGYMFSNLVGVEAGYIDLGSYSADGDNPGNALDLDADAFNAALVLNFNALEQLDIYIKGGAFLVRADSDSNAAGQTFRVDDDSTEPYGAIGLKADLGAWNIFGELSKVDTDVNDLSIDILSVGVRYEFGY
ncbi:MAG: outer membrane beta-barrel protein [Acidiferrobacterales bacterium]|nr:outer membrane beta-barrel protein [Acidiferrobacterales bacterium]